VLDALVQVLFSAGQSLWTATQILLLSAVLFGSLAILLKGDEAFAAGRRAARETRVNLGLFALDAVLVAPVMAVMVVAIRRMVSAAGATVVSAETWSSAGTIVTVFAAVFMGDLVSYWRHRFEHTRLLWPSHAIHHSDTEMTWLTLARFHPINRATTAAIDILPLAVLGFPDWALIANQMLRHYYGEFVHADLPWTYGPLKGIFVSPVMHRWHHARDVVGAGSNFATVFCLFDRVFKTYYVPGLCTVPLGVTDEMGQGTIRQLLYPFVAWSGFIGRRLKSPEPGTPAEAPRS
jgi:sterol desaturase/sphingolipid hydroxylase (fatty acid hydroxylase superfamily)